MEAAFHAAKAALAAAMPLDHPIPAADVSLAVDASATHVGAVLQQRCGRGWRPLSFFSRKLSTAEMKYSAFDRELLAAFAAVRHFRFWCEGRNFTLFTDHKPLTTAIHRVSVPWTARQQRQLAFLAEFDATWVHLPGADNVVADSLSRPVEAAGAVSTACGPENGCPSAPGACNSEKAAGELCGAGGALSTVEPVDRTWRCESGERGGVSLASVTVSGPAVPVPAVPAIPWTMFAEQQATCADVAALRASAALRPVRVPYGAVQLWCDVSTGLS